MPTVPKYNSQISPGQPRVREAGINPPRMVSPPVEALGAAGAKVKEQIGQGIYDVGMAGIKFASDEIRKENQLAEDARFFGLSSKVSEKAVQLQTQALSQKGRNALGAGEAIEKEWSKLQDEVLSEAGYSETLKARMVKDLNDQRLTLRKQYEVHAAREAEELQVNELSSAIKNSRDKAASMAFDDVEIGKQLNYQAQALFTQAQVKGIGMEDESFQLMMRENLSATHRKVIESRISGGGAGKAKEYFELNREGMTAEDVAGIEGDLKDSLIRSKADALSQEAVAKFRNLDEALKHFDSMKDLDIEEKKEAVAMTEKRFSIRESAKKKNQEDNFDALSVSVGRAVQMKNAGDPNAVSEMKTIQDSRRWAGLDQKYKDQLIHQFNDADQVNDDNVWLEFSSMGRGQIANMSNADYQMKVRSKLSKEYRDKADTLRKQSMEGAAEENQTISKWSTYGKDVQQYLAANKIYPPIQKPTQGLSNKKLEETIQANRDAMVDWNSKMIRIQEKVEQFEIRKKTKATPEEIRGIVADQLLNYSYPKNPNETKPLVAAPAPTSNAPDVEFDAIPQREKARGRSEFFKITGREPSDNELVEFFNAARTRDTKRIEKILGVRSPGQVTPKPRPQGASMSPLAPIDYRVVPEDKRVQ